MYVLEGSTLGGTMISRRLRQSLGLHPGSGGGAQFFFSYGPQVGRMWRDFTAALEAYSEGNAHGKDEEIVASAQATFRLHGRVAAGHPSATLGGVRDWPPGIVRVRVAGNGGPADGRVRDGDGGSRASGDYPDFGSDRAATSGRLPLARDDNTDYEILRTRLKPGDLLMMTTDSLTKSRQGK